MRPLLDSCRCVLPLLWVLFIVISTRKPVGAAEGKGRHVVKRRRHPPVVILPALVGGESAETPPVSPAGLTLTGSAGLHTFQISLAPPQGTHRLRASVAAAVASLWFGFRNALWGLLA